MATDERQARWYIRKEDIKGQLSKEDVERVYAHSTRSQKQKGDIFWLDDEHDDDSDHPKVFFIDQGYARICKISDDGRRLILTILGPGELFGTLSPDLIPSDLEDYVEVVKDLRLIGMDANVFHETVKKYPDFSVRLIEILEERRRYLERRLTSLLFKDVSARTAEFLNEICEKFGEPCPFGNNQYRCIALTHQELADMVGAARQVVSGIVSKLMKANIVVKQNNMLCVVDPAGIRKVINEGAKALPA